MNKIAASVTDAAAETLLEELVSAYSPSYQETGAVHRLVDWMAEHGYDRAFVDDAGNAVGIVGSGDQDVVLLGHIDTFPGDLPVRRKERLLYGRGTVDAKGPLCTFAAAGACASLPENIRLIVIGAVEEEAPTSKGARYALTQYHPHACVIGEPSHWDTKAACCSTGTGRALWLTAPGSRSALLNMQWLTGSACVSMCHRSTRGRTQFSPSSTQPCRPSTPATMARMGKRL